MIKKDIAINVYEGMGITLKEAEEAVEAILGEEALNSRPIILLDRLSLSNDFYVKHFNKFIKMGTTYV